jgi:ABC-type phosphate/phosphonate transport system substrate-binding protein
MIVASLPMYDWPEIRAHTDEFWNGLAKHAGLVGSLQRGGYYADVWKQPNLIFSQTCGYPFTHEFKGLLQYVATPHYAAEGCSGPLYSSYIFAREKRPLPEFNQTRAAINAKDSMSGMLALRLAVAPFMRGGEFFAQTLFTGSHLDSLAAVRENRADLCAIDAVCVALAKRYRPQALRGLVEVARTPMLPGLPYVTRAGDPEKLVQALKKTFVDPALASCRQALLLNGFSVLKVEDYQQIIDLENALPLFTL